MASVRIAVLVALAALSTLPACSTGAGGDPAPGPSAGSSRPEPCGLLSSDEVEGFLGEPARAGSEAEAAAGSAGSTCLWADADPAPPGRILGVHLSPAGRVGAPEPSEEDRVYELSQLGEGAVAVQRAGGSMAVLLTADRYRVELEYEVLPRSAAAGGDLDRLVELARLVRSRVGSPSEPEP